MPRDPDECEVLVGGGCAGARPEVTCMVESGGSGAPPPPEGDPAWVGGGGGACATAPGGAVPLLFLLLLFAARTAFAVDVQHLQLSAGGDIPGVADATRDAPWTPRVAVGAGLMGDPVRVRAGDGIDPLVTDLATVELSAALMVKDWFRVQVVAPGHRVRVAGAPPDSGPGDLGLQLVIPLGEHLAATTGLEAAPAGAPRFAHQGSATLGLAGRREVAFLELGGQARARFQEPGDLPGVRWGQRLELAGGLRTRGRLGLGVAGLAGAPLGLVLAPAAGAWPVEALGFGAARLTDGVHLDAGGGAGLTWGLGSPGWRAFATLRIEGRAGDRDQDRIVDLLDGCPRRPEDRDGFRDRGGCPDEDNDRDGLLDPVDECPLDPEEPNGFRDEDGCPDELGRWHVVVVAAEAPEQVRIVVDGEGSWQIEPERELVVVPGPHHLVVEAEGHRTFEAAVDVPPGESEILVRLHPLVTGELAVVLVDPDGQPLAGRVELGDEAFDVPEAGATRTLPTGALYGTARADGHLPEAVTAQVFATRASELRVVLEPVPPRAERPPVLFGLDQAELTDEAVALLDALAAWLGAHPDVRLLRIEGHADALGSPVYNYGLSVRRAHAVRDALVARGVAAERLDPIGAGEARAHLVPEALPPSFSAEVAGVPVRDVTFRVLVWDEDADALSERDGAW